MTDLYNGEEVIYRGYTYYIVGKRPPNLQKREVGKFYDLSKTKDNPRPHYKDIHESKLTTPEEVIYVAQGGWAMPVRFPQKPELVKC